MEEQNKKVKGVPFVVKIGLAAIAVMALRTLGAYARAKDMAKHPGVNMDDKAETINS